MRIYGGSSMLSVEGKFPSITGDTLLLDFRNWKLSNLDILTQLLNFEVDGIVNGEIEVSMVNNNPALVSDLRINGLALNKELLGDAHLLNTWDNTNNSIFLKSHVVRQGESGRGEVLKVSGYYYPFRDEDAIDLHVSFNRFKLHAIEPFVEDFITEIEGIASGDFKFTGSLDKPVIIGELITKRTAMKINYLNTKYSFSNNVYFERDRINFDELVLYDSEGNSANIDGFLNHTYFKKSRFDVQIITNQFLFFNTTRKMNDLYYGRAIARGNINLSGSPRDIRLNMDVATQNGTDVSIPLDYSVETSDKDYIVFVEPEIDSSEFEMFELEKTVTAPDDKSSYDIKLRMEMTPRAKITIHLPSDMGRIESQGSGIIRMNTNSKGDFGLIGDYTVEGGLFHFSLANLVSKRFELIRGGTISWTGDPYDATVNIKGMYRVRTNLSSLGLVIDSTADFKNKTWVECYVILRNQLLNPDIEFDIQFPDLNPDLQRLVYSQLDTTNQAMVNEQMISLLVLGSFSYSNASNVNLGTAYYTVLANQLSSMLSKISEDFDIGVHYRPGDNVSQEEFEVALSTAFFDDRLLVEGQFGMTYDRNTNDASNLVGDVDVGYKITEDGRWILKVFNHSNVNSWYNYSNFEKVSPYTQGVGVAFRKEFTHINDLFKRTRPRKEKKKKKTETETGVPAAMKTEESEDIKTESL
jgi:hypothetical protein